MAVDISKIKPGDEVTVKARVVESDGVSIRVRSCGVELWVPDSDIVSHTPRELQVGDRVKVPGYACTFEVRALDDGWAWLRDGDSSHIQWTAHDLERIP